MPVLSEDDVLEASGQGVDQRHDLLAAWHSEAAAGHEGVLHIDDEQDVAFHTITRSARTPARTALL